MRLAGRRATTRRTHARTVRRGLCVACSTRSWVIKQDSRPQRRQHRCGLDCDGKEPSSARRADDLESQCYHFKSFRWERWRRTAKPRARVTVDVTRFALAFRTLRDVILKPSND